jgi:hypothetical protein
MLRERTIMRYPQPLKQILAATRDQWDRPEIRSSVRRNFAKVLECRTLALGAEVYASQTEKKICYHTCKSRACPSCGHRATELWQRQQEVALPDVRYEGITLTMPDVLWPFFQENRHLLHDLPRVGAAAIEHWVKVSFGVRVLIVVVPHTFGRNLNFHPHLHVLVSAGGLQESQGRWIPIAFDKAALMAVWRFAVINYLWEAVQAKVLKSELSQEKVKAVLQTQYRRHWIIHVAHFKSKRQFLRYAGRYVRRPPIAQHRFLEINDHEVVFLTKDLKQKRTVETRLSTQAFVATLAQHIRDRYQHAIRYFGLLAPRSIRLTSAALFAVLGQQKRHRPPRLSWANSLRQHFGVDPLMDSQGRPMHRVGRLRPCDEVSL